MRKRVFCEYLDKIVWRLCTDVERFYHTNPDMREVLDYAFDKDTLYSYTDKIDCPNNRTRSRRPDDNYEVPENLLYSLLKFVQNVKNSIRYAFNSTKATDVAICHYLDLANRIVYPTAFEEEVRKSSNIWLYGRVTEYILEDIEIACRESLNMTMVNTDTDANINVYNAGGK